MKRKTSAPSRAGRAASMKPDVLFSKELIPAATPLHSPWHKNYPPCASRSRPPIPQDTEKPLNLHAAPKWKFSFISLNNREKVQ